MCKSDPPPPLVCAKLKRKSLNQAERHFDKMTSHWKLAQEPVTICAGDFRQRSAGTLGLQFAQEPSDYPYGIMTLQVYSYG